MKVRGLLIVSLVLALAMLGFGVWVAAGLEPGTRLPVHWNIEGEADRSAPAMVALILPAGMVVLLGMLFAALPRLEPLQQRLEASAPVLRAVWIGSLMVMAYVQVMAAAPALGWPIGPNLMLVGIGALLVMIGDALPKSRPSLFVGIRTPWTLRDADNWIATHRLGGKLMLIAGIFIVLAAFMPLPPGFRMIAIAGLVAAAALVPVMYSWWLARSQIT